MSRNRISIVGAGNVGATCAHWAAAKELGDIVLVDVVEGVPQGKALDLMEAGPVEGFDCMLSGTNDYEDTVGSDVAVITAGIARKPGMSRDDLVSINVKIVQQAAAEIARYSPDAIIIVVTNPLDVMCSAALKASGFPSDRVFGMSGILDSARLRTFLALELGISFEDVTTLVLGGHGDHMVPLVRYTYAGGIPVEKLLPRDRLDALVQRTRLGGAEIVEYLKTGSAYYAPGAAVVQMLEAVLKDKRRLLPCAAYLRGQYGHRDVYAGVPTVIGAEGVERIIELDLTKEEQAAFDRSVASVRAVLDKLDL
ncbi:MAG: malate dehydrogenase [Candidatus Desulforudis sp.]|nr:malate dehydrogenase [Desulforudis sp.]